jgi:hypothetical protein
MMMETAVMALAAAVATKTRKQEEAGIEKWIMIMYATKFL